MKPALAIVPDATDGPPIDITALNRADIKARNWSAVHIAADRRQPVAIEDCKKRTWR
jgi:hypothetical protein